MSRTVSLICFFRKHRPTHKILVERLFPTLATLLFVWSCRLKGFTKTVLGNCWPNKAEMAVHGNTFQVKWIKCAVTVKKVILAAMDDDNVENHLFFVAQIILVNMCKYKPVSVVFFWRTLKTPFLCMKNSQLCIISVRCSRTQDSFPGNKNSIPPLSMKSEYCQGLSSSPPLVQERGRQGRRETLGTKLEIGNPSSS